MADSYEITQARGKESQRLDQSMIEAEPPDRALEDISLQVDLSAMKGSPLDQKSAHSISTDEDSQNSHVISNHEDDLKQTLPNIIVSSVGSRNIDQSSDHRQQPLKSVYRCEFCFKAFPKRSRLLSHIIVHSNLKDFVCVVCGKGFKNRPQLQRHSNTHSEAPNFCCNICGRGFKHNDVAKHVRRFHSGPRKSRRGGVANPNAPINSEFNSHPNIQSSLQSTEQFIYHESQDPLQQQTHLPPLHQTQQSVISQHQPSHHAMHLALEQERVTLQDKDQGEEKFSVLREREILDPSMGSMDSFSCSSNDSMQICSAPSPYSQFSCSHCSMTLSSQNELAVHLKSHLKPELKTVKGRKKHQCHVCHKSFTRASGLAGHLQLHIRTERRKEPNPDFCCTICGKMFTRRAGLNAHVLQHGGVLRFWCDEPECGKGFVHTYQLIRHKRMHSDILPYTCDICGRSFRHNDLAKHMRTHTGDKPYSCQHCGKAFASSSSFRTHERMHIALKEHLCEICNMGFTTSAGLRRHSKTHDEEKEELCASCGKFFPSKFHFSRHLQESQQCSQQQHQLDQVHVEQSHPIHVMPVPQPHAVQQHQVTPHIAMHGMHMEVQEIDPIAIHQVDPIQLNHQNNSETLTTLAAPDPASVMSEHGQQNPVENLPVLVPFSLSVPISMPFGINLSAAPPEPIQLSHYVSWEQKF